MDFSQWEDDRLLRLWKAVQAAMEKGDMRVTSVSGLSGSMGKAFVTDPVQFHNDISAEVASRPALSSRIPQTDEARVDMSGMRGVS